MIKQIIATVQYFRNKGMLEAERRATAIVSFPNLLEDFDSTFWAMANKEADKDVSQDKLLEEYKILIQPRNSVKIVSEKRLSWQRIFE
jgi:hypothetical protein